MLAKHEVWLCRFNINNEHTGIAEAFLFNVNAPSEILFTRETEVPGLKVVFDIFNEPNGSITVTNKNGIEKTVLTDIRSEKFEVYTDPSTGAQITITYNIDINPLLPLLPRLAEIILMMVNVTESGKLTLPDGAPANLQALARAFVLGGVSRVKAKIDFGGVIGADFGFQVGSSIYDSTNIEGNEIAGTFTRPFLGDASLPSSQYMANFITDGTGVFLNAEYVNDTKDLQDQDAALWQNVNDLRNAAVYHNTYNAFDTTPTPTGRIYIDQNGNKHAGMKIVVVRTGQFNSSLANIGTVQEIFGIANPEIIDTLASASGAGYKISCNLPTVIENGNVNVGINQAVSGRTATWRLLFYYYDNNVTID
jgi:hypothetical protein